jgi:cysteinyl-tRNA synthetase
MALKIYNTLTRKKDEFVPLHPGEVRIYVCGPTVYSDAHLGHAKSYISFDIVVRYLRWSGYKVKYVQNLTDVGHMLDSGEDRILLGAKREQLDPMELVEKYIRGYFEDMDALNVLRPDISPRASGHIIEQIDLVQTLLEKGCAYEVDGSVYFDITKFPDYGKLSHRKVEDQEAGARVEVRTEKKHPADFTLWVRAAPEHIMQWNSPWGRGYPGWHVECSAMSMKYLGDTIDIHGGGMENAFPHHECEIAQSEAATGKQFVRYWMHHNMVLVDGVKMGKSLDNFLTIGDALKNYSPQQIRLFTLTTHYRSPVDFSQTAIEAAGEGLKKINTALERIAGLTQSAPDGELVSQVREMADECKKKFVEAMDDDFSTPVAIGALFDFFRDVNKYLDKEEQVSRGTLTAVRELYDELGVKVLGIVPDVKESEIGGSKFIDLLIEVREQLRTEKQWQLSDDIRSKLKELGITLEDASGKTTWKTFTPPMAE